MRCRSSRVEIKAGSHKVAPRSDACLVCFKTTVNIRFCAERSHGLLKLVVWPGIVVVKGMKFLAVPVELGVVGRRPGFGGRGLESGCERFGGRRQRAGAVFVHRAAPTACENEPMGFRRRRRGLLEERVDERRRPGTFLYE